MTAAQVLDSIPDEWGPKFGRDCAAAAVTSAGPGSIHYTSPAHVFIVFFTAQAERHVAINSDHRVCGFCPVGSLEIIPRHAEVFAQWTTDKQNLLVALDDSRLRRLAGLEFDNEDFDFHIPKLGHIDPKAHTIAQQIRAEMRCSDIADAECIDAWLTLFATHVLRNYSNLGYPRRTLPKGGLPSRVWRRVNDYILSNLSEKLTLAKMAEVTSLSPAHFARAFRQTVGQAPHQYVIASRLNYARERIRASHHPLDQIAREAGFSNHSHMTAIMRRYWGVTPSQLRREAGARPPD